MAFFIEPALVRRIFGAQVDSPPRFSIDEITVEAGLDPETASRQGDKLIKIIPRA